MGKSMLKRTTTSPLKQLCIAQNQLLRTLCLQATIGKTKPSICYCTNTLCSSETEDYSCAISFLQTSSLNTLRNARPESHVMLLL